jgi:formylglycine-generating enzyme required for sulfatase activity
MKKLLIIAALALCGMALHGQQQTLVIPPFVNLGTDLGAAALNSLRDSLIKALVNTGRFQIHSGDILARTVREHGFEPIDWWELNRSAEMGRALRADYIIWGIARRERETNLLETQVAVLNADGGVSVERIPFTNQRDALGKADDFVSGILQAIARGPQSASPYMNIMPAWPLWQGEAIKNFVPVEGGSFTMGSPANEPGRKSDEGPQHQVTVKSFDMGKYEVSQREWRELMGNNRSTFRGDNLPVENVNWYEAIEYCNRRSVREGLTPAYHGSGDSITCDWNANRYRLPTEAEWEYASKGGSSALRAYMYAGSGDLDAVAWYSGNSGRTTHPVGTKAPNELGIYDLSGNVAEWCWDWYGEYHSGAQTNPAGPASGADRVVRGGIYEYGWQGARSSSRSYIAPDYRDANIGFRLVRSR